MSIKAINAKEIMTMLTLTQYLDTLKSMGTSANSKVIFVDSNLGKTSTMVQELSSAIETSSHMK
ncbi:MAG: hypothetical protein EXS46_00320 [Candidatus Taylorbacteria bacterium]|nr:hypothetical protein [Candidatus Taylorbacteria bacterium]